MADAVRTDLYDPPHIESRTSIEAPLVAVAGSGVNLSAAFRPL